MPSKLPNSSDYRQPRANDEDDAASGPAVCGICNKRYSRVEHLMRHQRSHTQEKPFVCPVCQKSFARTDVLKRHYIGHLDTEGPRKRLRVSNALCATNACTACAESKVRCEGGIPCRRCLSRNQSCLPRQGMAEQQPDPGLKHKERQQQRDSTNSGETTEHLRCIQEDLDTCPYTPDEQGIGDNLSVEESPEPDVTITSPNLPLGDQECSAYEPILEPAAESESNQATLIPNDLDFGPIFDDLQLANPLMSLMFKPATHGQPAQAMDHLQPFGGGDVLDFTGESLELFDLQPFWVTQNQQQAASVEPREPKNSIDTQCGDLSSPQLPRIQEGISLGVQAFRDSLWQFNPCTGNQWKCQVEELSQSPPSIEQLSFRSIKLPGAPKLVTLQPTMRNKIMSMILSLSDNNSVERVASLLSWFPSTELLTSLTNQFLATHMGEVDTFIHIPTFKPEGQTPELVLGMIACAALNSPIPPLHEFGALLQEAHRELNRRLNADDNRNIRLIVPLQSFALGISSGLWSGDRRKLEIAECFRNCLITMMRRGHIFHAYNFPSIIPQLEDSPQVTEEKWRAWIKYESFKRLAIHIWIADVQFSMSLFLPLLVSPTEMLQTLPACRQLWEAKTSSDWKNIYLAMDAGRINSLPSIRSCIDDFGLVLRFGEVADTQLTSLAILSGLWSSILSYRQKLQLQSSKARNSSLIINALYQEAKDVLQAFKVVFAEWVGELDPIVQVLHERQLMSLDVSLEDVQLFGGRAGEIEARRVIPMLTQWTKSRESRQALIHAGQLLRAAKRYPGPLPAPVITGVYHASLVLWAHATILSTDPSADHSATDIIVLEKSNKVICLDGDGDVQPFLTVGYGTPVITLHSTSAGEPVVKYIPVRDGKAVMTTVVDLILTKNGVADSGHRAPLVANLGRLMLDLGDAAAEISRKALPSMEPISQED